MIKPVSLVSTFKSLGATFSSVPCLRTSALACPSMQGAELPRQGIGYPIRLPPESLLSSDFPSISLMVCPPAGHRIFNPLRGLKACRRQGLRIFNPTREPPPCFPKNGEEIIHRLSHFGTSLAALHNWLPLFNAYGIRKPKRG